MLDTRPTVPVRVRFEVRQIANSVDEELLAIASSGWDAILLGPDQPPTDVALERFEVALIGNARLAVKRFGQHSGSFDKKWIEVTGTCRYLEEGDVTVCQLPITEIDMIQIHDNDWQQYESGELHTNEPVGFDGAAKEE